MILHGRYLHEPRLKIISNMVDFLEHQGDKKTDLLYSYSGRLAQNSGGWHEHATTLSKTLVNIIGNDIDDIGNFDINLIQHWKYIKIFLPDTGNVTILFRQWKFDMILFRGWKFDGNNKITGKVVLVPLPTLPNPTCS